MSESESAIPYEVKQPWEEIVYDLDFTKLLRTGETITDIFSITGAPAGLTITDPAIASPLVQAKVAGGVDGTDYKLTARVITTFGAFGQRREGEGEIRVRDL